MAKKKPEIKLIGFGIYTQWDTATRELPKLIKRTRCIPCEIDVEFGYVVNIRKAKNKELTYCIYHPNIPDEQGVIMPPFLGVEYIRQNEWNFFIGDTVWSPVENKAGQWRITLELDGEIVADETFELLLSCAT